MTRLLAALAFCLVALPAFAGPDCKCRSKDGSYVPEGGFACLKATDGSQRLAQCSMVLNNTAWKFTEMPCPQMSLAPAGNPVFVAAR